MILVFTTIVNKAEAYKIGRKLLEEKLIACYNLTEVESSYWWEGEIKITTEALLILKTRDENFEKVESFLKEHSGYEVPEVVSVKAEKVNQPYLDWISEVTEGS